MLEIEAIARTISNDIDKLLERNLEDTTNFVLSIVAVDIEDLIRWRNQLEAIWNHKGKEAI